MIDLIVTTFCGSKAEIDVKVSQEMCDVVAQLLLPLVIENLLFKNG
ncbi:MAG: hypothetical protein LBD15_00390 [Holosporales bacterium]|nr:hypothetical protein [Holosporales bacterium]